MAAVILAFVAIGISAIAAYYTYQTTKIIKEIKDERKRLAEESRRNQRTDDVVHKYVQFWH
jgi:archaellum component FlaG (FlaF/FlaG flagellin family)